MEPLTNDDAIQDEEEPAAETPDAGVVTGPAPYEAADDDEWDD